MTGLACPVCRAELREVETRGLIIDACGQCGGIWLDRDAVEKLAVMFGQGQSTPAFAEGSAQPLPGSVGMSRPRRRDDDDDDDDDRREGPRRKQKSDKRRKSLLDLFD